MLIEKKFYLDIIEIYIYFYTYRIYVIYAYCKSISTYVCVWICKTI